MLIYIGQHLKVIKNVISYLQPALSSVVNSHHQEMLLLYISGVLEASFFPSSHLRDGLRSAQQSATAEWIEDE